MLTGRLNPYGGSIIDADARERLSILEQKTIDFNHEFSDIGFWDQVKGGNKFDDTAVIHAREISENFRNLEVSPAFASQTLVHYNPESQDGELFTRIANAYHELIVDGEAMVPFDSSSPNFTTFGVTK